MNAHWLRFLPRVICSRLDGRPVLQGAIGNTGWLLGDRLLRLSLGLFVGIWVARYLGPDQFGIISYAVALIAIFGAFANLGLDSVVVRDLVHDPEAKNDLLGSAFALRFGAGALAFATATVTGLALRPDDAVSQAVIAITAAGLVFQAFDTIDLWFQSKVRAKYVVYARNTAFLLVVAVKIALILGHAPLIAFAWAGFGEVVLGSLGLALVYRSSGNRLTDWRVSSARIRSLAAEGWPLVLAGIAVMLYMKIDQIMLGEMLGSQAVGIYSAATRISEAWYFIPLAIATSVAPSIMAAKKVDPAVYYARVERFFRIMAWLSLLVALPMSLLSNIIVLVLFGPDYRDAGPVLALHIWATVFIFLGVAQNAWTVSEGLMKLSALRTFVGAVANIGLNLLLIPSHGPMGAAVATLISYALSAVVLNALDTRTRRIFWLQLRAFLPRARA